MVHFLSFLIINVLLLGVPSPSLEQMLAPAVEEEPGWEVPISYIGYLLPLIEIKIGTPPVKELLLMDTGSPFVWTQCSPCKSCFHQLSPPYTPNASSTYASIPCSDQRCTQIPWYIRQDCTSGPRCPYTAQYGFASNDHPDYTSGTLASENFTLGLGTPRKILFGCSDDSAKTLHIGDGIAGIGRGKYSLPSQLGVTKFSYNLPFPEMNKKGVAGFGSKARLSGSPTKTIPFAKVPSEQILYYLSLTGITVGDVRVAVRKEKKSIYVDTGAPTYLEPSLYDLVQKAMENELKLPRTEGDNGHVCFVVPAGAELESLGLPKLVYHFQDGDDWEFGIHNYFEKPTRDKMCFLILRGENSVVGVELQYGSEVLFDLQSQKLHFSTGCASK